MMIPQRGFLKDILPHFRMERTQPLSKLESLPHPGSQVLKEPNSWAVGKASNNALQGARSRFRSQRKYDDLRTQILSSEHIVHGIRCLLPCARSFSNPLLRCSVNVDVNLT
jgi:hypothetical protein